MLAATAEAYSDQKLIFALAALMFFAIPIRYSDPDTVTVREFQHFITTFNRTYYTNETEYRKRFQIFKKSFQRLENSHPVFGINRYSDMSNYEFRQKFLQAKASPSTSRQRREISASCYRRDTKNFGTGPAPLPQVVDWRERGIVTPIRSQGTCRSGYAHSVTAIIESMHAMKWNRTTAVELNVQQMIDRSGNTTVRCKSGDTCQLLQLLKKENVTILPEHHNPNESHVHDRTARVTDYTCFNFVGNEPEMLAYLAFKGPLIAAVNALPWKQYVGGVIKSNCHGPANHAVQIVGYNLDGQREEQHFVVRNSWGIGFGHRGYAKIAIGGNVCGIADQVSSITVD